MSAPKTLSLRDVIDTAATTIIFLILVSLGGVATPLAAAAVAQAQAEPVTILERGPHHRIVQSASGGTYTELADGLCYKDEAGNYIDSEELFELNVLPGFAVARRGAHTATLAANINSERVVELIAPDGKRFVSRVAGLSYLSADTGENILIAQIQDSIGVLHPPNQIIYPDALVGNGVRADVRYTWRKNGFEQDIIIREIAAPEAYGLDPARTRLQCWTMFLEAPQPEIETRVLSSEQNPALRQAMAEPDFTDQRLNFGVLHISDGRAFSLDAQQDISIPVGKEFGATEKGERFLIETVEYSAAKPSLETLPKQARINNQNNGNLARLKLSRPQVVAALSNHSFRKPANKQEIQVAKLGTSKQPGFVLDYQSLYGPPYTYNNYVFAADQTYYLTAQVTLTGTAILERGTVLKLPYYSPGTLTGLRISGSANKLISLATAWNPCLITAKDDNTVGEPISGSTGSPSGFYGNPSIYVEYPGASLSLSNLHIRYAYIGIHLAFCGSGHELRHSQLINCGTAVQLSYSTLHPRNVLVYSSYTGSSAGVAANGDLSSYLRGENLTIHQVSLRPYGVSYPTIYLTNSLLAGVSGYFSGINNQNLSSDTGVFQTVGAGSHYLLDETYRDQGTTDIDPNLLADLRKRTTHPPVVFAANAALPPVLSPEIPRDEGAIDLGYHFDPIDFAWNNLTISASSSLMLTGGVVIAHFGNKGTTLAAGAKLISEGFPTNRNRIIQYAAVQELPVAWGTLDGTFSALVLSGTQPDISLRFTDIDFVAGVNANRQVLDFSTYSPQSFTLKDCELTSPYFNLPSGASATVTLINNLFRRASWTLRRNASTSVSVSLFNNTFINSTLALTHDIGTGTWEVRDNFFDTVTLTAGTQTIANSHNAYLSTTTLPGSSGNNQLPTTRDYQSGALGTNYYPAVSGNNLGNLVGTGSRAPGIAGLYHHTVKSDQSKAGTIASISIGYHYIALNSGLPINSDSDLLADYFEDRNGNNVVDSDETNWNSGYADTDGDTVDDATERFQGRNPRVANTVPDTSGTLVNLRIFTPSR